MDLPGWSRVAAIVLAIALLALAARRLPWFKLEGDAEARRVLLAATAILAAMRWFNTDALAGVQLHFLGAAIATLMFGPAFALWVMAVASVAAWAMGSAWFGLAPDFLVAGALPVAMAAVVSRLANRLLPPHLLVYVMANAFFGGALSMGVSTLFKASVSGLLGSGAHQAYLIATIPLMFGEGFFTGAAMALIVVYRPQWCSSFDDATYLGRGD